MPSVSVLGQNRVRIVDADLEVVMPFTYETLARRPRFGQAAVLPDGLELKIRA